MAKVDWDQNAQGVSSGFEVLPKGRYLAVVADTQNVKTKDKKGSYIETEFVVSAPKDYKGRKLWARFNVHNPSEAAQRIGREQFNSLADCCDLLGKVTDTKLLHDKAVVVLVSVKPASGDYKEQNEIVGFQRYEGPQPSARSASPAKEAKTPPPPTPPARKAADDSLDDDIPF